MAVDGVGGPVMVSILPSKVATVSVTSTLIGTTPGAVVPVFTKLITVPLTVMVSPGAKLVPSAFAPAAPDNVVVPLMGTGLAALLSTTLPATCSGGNVTDGGVLKPSAANAAPFVVVTFRPDPALLRNVIAPPLTVDGARGAGMGSVCPG